MRVIRACREMGIATVAVYTECDRAALHVRLADEAWPVGPNPPRESYLRIDTIVDVARQSGADAVHPGYGFLAENADFARACRDAGLTFIGPSPEAIALMGSKTAARQVADGGRRARRAGHARRRSAPTCPTPRSAAIAERIGYPLMLKAVAGGGGKGMRMVARRRGAARRRCGRPGPRPARRSATSAVYLERRLVAAAPHRGAAARRSPRHRRAVRRARVLDPAPAPEGDRGEPVAGRVDPDLRRRITAAAAAVAAAGRATPMPAPSSSCSTTTGRSTFSR